MKERIHTLFLDIGGVLLTNGWDSEARNRAIEHFNLDKEELGKRHELIFDTYELGKLSLDDYLKYVIFYEPRKFGDKEFKDFMFAQSLPLDGAIDFFKELKKKHGLRVIALNNEPREINDYRIEKYKLRELFDLFVSSCYINMRKPDPKMYQLAYDLAYTKPENALYIDDRGTYIDMANGFGFPSYHYTGLDSAKEYFKNALQ